MKYLVIFLVLAGLFTSSAFAFEPSYTNYFSNPEFKIYKVQENAYEFSIPYKISDAKLDRIVVDCDSRVLIIYLDAVGTEGNLIINIPRALLDAKINDQDDALFFILDQQEVEPPEINTDSDSRTFDIPLQTDGEILEIIAEIVGVYPEPNPCGVGGDDKSPYYRLLSPLKQSQSGIPFNEIQCKQNLVLIQKYDGTPACVTEQTKTKLVERGWTTKDDSVLSKINARCMTIEQSKQIAPFFKTPTYLPEGYSHVCSQSGTPFESYILYYYQESPNQFRYLPVIDDAIFIYQYDSRRIGLDKELPYDSPEQHIQEIYDGVMKNNPSLNPQLITINGMLAYAVDSCPDCGMQIANFSDGTVIQKSTSTETKIEFMDENGVKYMLVTTLPLSELIKVAESLR